MRFIKSKWLGLTHELQPKEHESETVLFSIKIKNIPFT